MRFRHQCLPMKPIRPLFFTLTAMILLGFLGLGQNGLAQTRYTFTGNLFTSADPPYTTANRVTGFFETAIPLPPLMATTEIGHLVTAFSFADGQQVRNSTNSRICRFRIATDGSGHIIEWAISFRETFPLVNPQKVMDVSSFGDQVGSGTAGASECAQILLSTSASSASPGTWTDPLPLGIPVSYAFTGKNFDSVTPPYTQNMRVTGLFQVRGALPPWMPMTDIGHAVETFSFSDGVQVRTSVNSVTCRFEVATDGAGHIAAWRIGLRQSGVSPGNLQQAMDITTSGDAGGRGTVGSSPCAFLIFTNGSAINFEPGTWTDPFPIGTIRDYGFTGTPFVQADPPYQSGDFVSGFLQFGNPLPAYLPETDLAFALLDFEFDDGVQLRTPSNTIICNLRVVTGANGQPFRWAINLRETPFTPGQPQRFLDVTHFGDLGGSGNADASPCGTILASFAGTSFEPGTWDGGLPAAPAIYLYTGKPFGSAQLPFQTGKKVSGRITLPGPLKPNMQLFDATDFLIDWRFSDSQFMHRPQTANPCLFELVTNASGDIIQWRISLVEFYDHPNVPQRKLNVTNLGLSRSDNANLQISTTMLCNRSPIEAAASSTLIGTWTMLCPTLLANFENWPQTIDITGLLSLACP